MVWPSTLVLDLHHVDPVQVLLEPAHVAREVLHICVDCECEVLDQTVEVTHFLLNALESLPQNQTQIGFVLGQIDKLVIDDCGLLIVLH